MSTYCECGHVLMMHERADVDPESGEDTVGPCFDPDGCECAWFVEVSPEELERGWD